MKPEMDAKVTVRDRGIPDPYVLACLFVYTTPTGIVWVEPTYLDPIPYPRPADHRADGKFTAVTTNGFTVTSGDRTTTVERFDPRSDDRHGIGRSLRWAAEELARRGTTLEAERERVREIVVRDDD